MRVKLNLREIFILGHYYRVFHRYVGHRIALLSLGATLTTLTEGVGIALFLSYVQWLGSPGTAAPKVVEWIQAWLNGLGLDSGVGTVVLVLVAVFLLRGTLLLIQNSYHYRLVMQMSRRLSERVLEKISRLSYRDFLKRDTGEFTHLATKESERSITAFYQVAFLIPKFITIGIYGLLSLRFEWKFAVVAVGLGAVLVLGYRWVTRASRALSQVLSASESRYTAQLIQMVQSFKYLRATGGLTVVQERVLDHAHTNARLGGKIGFLSALIPATSESLIVILLAVGMTIQTQVLRGDWATVAVTILFLYRMLRELMVVQGSFQVFSTVRNGVDRVEAFLNSPEDTSQSKDAPSASAEAGLSLEMRNVSFAYGAEPVLVDVSAKFERAKVHGIVGESGAGKSTLADLMLGLLVPSRGEILRQARATGGRARVGYVTQENVIFDASIRDNVSLWSARVGQDDSRVWAALTAAGAAPFVRELGGQLEETVGERGVRLSGGQRQRLAIARELYREPELLILDEATSALDAESEHFVQESVRALKGKVTLLVIAHRLATIREADQILVLDHGRLVQVGTFETLAQEPGKFKRLVELQDLRVKGAST